MKCVNCSVEHADLVFKFCPSCGSAQIQKCKTCECALPVGSKFCPDCGAPTSQSAASATNGTHAVHPVQRILPPTPTALVAKLSQDHNAIRERFAKYWAKASNGPFLCWKFSETSLAEAQRLATERVSAIAEKFRTFGLKPERYLYSDTRLREPVIQEITGAIVSRNSYGCFVLNTSQAMFIDIDFEGPRNPQTGESNSIEKRVPEIPNEGGFFSFKNKDQIRQAFFLEKIQNWLSNKPHWGVRIYRTAAGLRLLATHDVFDPEAPETYTIFSELYADPLYTKLCKVQKCFRARLTPKPWRCNLPAPKQSWPWESASEEDKFNEWAKNYAKKSIKYATCSLVTVLGNSLVHPEIEKIIALHDEMTRINTGLTLA